MTQYFSSQKHFQIKKFQALYRFVPNKKRKVAKNRKRVPEKATNKKNSLFKDATQHQPQQAYCAILLIINV